MINTTLIRKICGKYDYYFDGEYYEIKKVFCLDNEKITLDDIFENINVGDSVEIRIKTQ
jgi:hypothetical protein